mgnify:CR=1 FL=1
MIMSYLFRFDKHLHRGAYIRPSVVGSHSLRAGMYVTGISEMKIATKNGTRLFITFSRRCFANEHPTNRTLPTGGVMVPPIPLTVRQPELDLVTANAAVYLEKGGNSDSQQHDDNDGQQDF